MNYQEFEEKVLDMGIILQENNVKPEDVKIEYTRLDGHNCLWAMKDDTVITYFKW